MAPSLMIALSVVVTAAVPSSANGGNCTRQQPALSRGAVMLQVSSSNMKTNALSCQGQSNCPNFGGTWQGCGYTVSAEQDSLDCKIRATTSDGRWKGQVLHACVDPTSRQITASAVSDVGMLSGANLGMYSANLTRIQWQGGCTWTRPATTTAILAETGCMPVGAGPCWVPSQCCTARCDRTRRCRPAR